MTPIPTRSWRPPPRPAATRIDLRCEPIVVASYGEDDLGQAVDVVSVPIVRPRRPRVRGFTFAGSGATAGLSSSAGATVGQANRGTRQWKHGQANRGTRATPIRPPRDVIKLQDRLGYILQPSLEVLLAERSLRFPCEPFAYQLEGVAFLYPRQAAILADEMGLGKTMQALRRVLLICPKPLVANWQREFGLWAPEIPLVVIGGNQATRRWQWQLDNTPVKIANYELLHRDRQWFDCSNNSGGGPLDFDLIVLDESQRIKNRHSATSHAARAIAGRRRWAR
jgi:hypothetical protein